MAVLDNIRYATDLSLAVPHTLGFRLFTITLIKTTTVGADRPGHGGTATTVRTPLVNYNNAPIRATQVSAKDVILSGGLLTDKDWSVGPIVFPYDTGTNTGGFDLANFLPASTPDPVEMFIEIQGNGMAPNGSLFKKIYDVADGIISYTIFVQAIGKGA